MNYSCSVNLKLNVQSQRVENILTCFARVSFSAPSSEELCFFSNHSCHHIFPRISVTYLHRFLSRGSSRLSAHKAVLPWQVQWISDWRSCQSAWTCLKCKSGDCIFEWKEKKKSSLNICVICNICKLGQVSTIFYHLVQFIHHRLWLLWSRMEV